MEAVEQTELWMRWAVIYRDRGKHKITVSRRSDTRQDGLSEAFRLFSDGHEVHALVGPDGEVISRPAIDTFCKKRCSS